MRHLSTIILLIQSIISDGQRVTQNLIDEKFDALPQYDLNLKNSPYRIAEQYDNFPNAKNNKAQVCRTISMYNDSGMLIKIVSGANVVNGKIDYTITYTLLNDSTLITDLKISNRYIDSTHAFQFDTLEGGKYVYRNIYKRNRNNETTVKSIIHFTKDSDFPKSVYRYDEDGILKEIEYPIGLDTVLATPSTLIDTSDSHKNVQLTAYAYQSLIVTEKQTSSKEGKVLQTISSQIQNGTTHVVKISTNYYNNKGRLATTITSDSTNRIIQTDSYTYSGENLKSYTLDYDPSDNIVNESKTFDGDGNLIKWTRNSIGSPIGEQKWVFAYSNKLLSRQDIFLDNKLYKSTTYKYRN